MTIPLFCRKPVKWSYYCRLTWRTELYTWSCVYSSRIAHHYQIFTSWGSGTMDAGRHLLFPLIDPFVVQRPYTLSVISQFSLNVLCCLNSTRCPCQYLLTNYLTPLTPKCRWGYCDRCLHCNGRPSTSVICDAQRRQQWLACPFLDVVFPWFTRSYSPTTAIYCFLCAHITRWNRLIDFGHWNTGKLSSSFEDKFWRKIWRLLDGELFYRFWNRCIFVFVQRQLWGSCPETHFGQMLTNCVGVKPLDSI